MDYQLPEWSGNLTEEGCMLEVIKNGVVLQTLPIGIHKEYVTLGRLSECDVSMEHPSISRYHAVIQFDQQGAAFLYDLNSVHGTFLNKEKITSQVYRSIPNQSVLQFGQSSRMYILHLPIREQAGEELSVQKQQEQTSAVRHLKTITDVTLSADKERGVGKWYDTNPKKVLTEWLDERGYTFQVNYEEEGNGRDKIYTAHVHIPAIAIEDGTGEDMAMPSIDSQGQGSKKKDAEREACLDACHKLAALGQLNQHPIATTIDDYDRAMKRMLKRKAGDDDVENDDSFYDRTRYGKVFSLPKEAQ
jgi:pSer/pThr/pTyr-binding forkhead associated (FHA) protein